MMLAADIGSSVPLVAGGSAAMGYEPSFAKQVELHLPSILGYEKIARSAVETIAEEMEFDSERIENLKTAVAEACMNAIEHGNHLDRTLPVTVQMCIMPDKLEVRVIDIGHQPLPVSLPEPGSGTMRGWGMFFIKNLVDRMETVQLPDGGNQITMTLFLMSQDDVHSAPEPANAPHQAGAPAETSALEPAQDAPKAVQVVTPQPVEIQPAEDRPKAVQQVTPQPVKIQPAESKPKAIQPVEVPPRGVQIVEDRPKEIQAVVPLGTSPVVSPDDSAVDGDPPAGGPASASGGAAPSPES